MLKVFSIASNTFKEAIRNKLLYVVLLFLVFILSLAMFMGSVSIGSRKEVLLDFGLFSISLFTSFLTIINGANLFIKELKLKTIYNILSKSISRETFILGKFIGLTYTASAIVIIMSFALYLVVGLFENTYEPLIFVAAFYTILEQAIIVAIVMLFSSFSVTTFLPGFLTVAFYIVGHSLSILKYFLVEDTNRVLYWTIYLIYICLPDFGVFNHNQEIVYNLPMSIDHLYKSIVYTVFYCFSLLLISMRLFRFRDL